MSHSASYLLQYMYMSLLRSSPPQMMFCSKRVQVIYYNLVRNKEKIYGRLCDLKVVQNLIGIAIFIYSIFGPDICNITYIYTHIMYCLIDSYVKIQP